VQIKTRRRGVLLLASAVVLVSGSVWGGPSLPAASAVLPTAKETVLSTNDATAGSRFLPREPVRVLDTRANGLRLAAEGTITVAVPGGRGASAAVANVTLANAGGAGFVTAFPAGQVRPDVSNMNMTFPGQTVASLVTVPLDEAGQFTVYSSAPGDVLVDVFGIYQPVVQSRDGRFVALSPTRALDTRAQYAPFAPRERRTVRLPMVPADAVAAVVNLTAVHAPVGYFTAWSGGKQPITSNLNVATSGQTIANQAIVPLHAGSFDVFSEAGGDLLVDVAGFYTGASADQSSSGLFMPVGPTRLLDTRGTTSNPIEDRLKPRKDWIVEFGTGSKDLPLQQASAVVMTTTVVHAESAGFATVWAAGTTQPDASNINTVSRGDTIANHVISPVTTRGVSVSVSTPMHMLADVSGWFTGVPMQAKEKPITNQLPKVQGRLSIPAIGLTMALGDGDDDETLNRGPMHWSYSSMPGELGTMNILGHRSSYGSPFMRIGDLHAGDLIEVVNAGQTFTYRVSGSRVVRPSEVLPLTDPGTANLKLVACHPIGSAEQRLVVSAELV
jgi:LPXTG-site transpeptidase (sortase) family protein